MDLYFSEPSNKSCLTQSVTLIHVHSSRRVQSFQSESRIVSGSKRSFIDEFLLFWSILIHNSKDEIRYKFKTSLKFDENVNIRDEIDYLDLDIIKKLPDRLKKTAKTINDLIESQIMEPIPIMLRKLVQNVLVLGLEKFFSKKQIQIDVPRRDVKKLISLAQEKKLISAEIADNLLAIKYLGGIEAHNIFYDTTIKYVKSDLRNICIFINIFYNRLNQLDNSK